jgi:hypothetical protein
MSKCTSSTGCVDGRGSAPVGYKVHSPMQHGKSYTGSHWMPPSGNHLLRIAPGAARATGKQMTMKKYIYFSGHFDGHDDVRYVTACMALWRRSRASLEATGCRIRAIIDYNYIKGHTIAGFLSQHVENGCKA